MIAHGRSLPHPVLSPFRDDIQPNAFNLALSVAFDADNYYLTAALSYSNESIASLVDRGQAVHAIHVECRRNFYRKFHRLPTVEGRIAIPASELAGKVEVTPFVIARHPIEPYEIAGAHADYAGAVFRVEAGDQLATGTTRSFEAYTDYDPLKRLSSILTVERSLTATDGPMEVATHGDRIVATLAQTDFDLYTHLRADPTIASLLSNQVTVPALLEALFEMSLDRNDAIEEGMERRWYRSVSKKLESLGIDVRDGKTTPLDALQGLLKNPVRRSLIGLEQATADLDEA